MDLDERKKRQTLKVLLIESFMSVAVVVTVIILVLVVSGYSISSDYKLEQGGLLRIDSEPVGASVIVDGEKLGDTNFSKVVSSTEHEVILEKDGYDVWKKKINVAKGLLYHLRYPRLFLKERSKEQVYNFDDIEFASVSPDHNNMFLIEKDLNWSFFDLRNEKLNKKSIPTSFLASDTKLEVKQALWSRNGRRVILESNIGEKRNWIYVDFDNKDNSFSLSDVLGIDFERITILDDSANELLAYTNKSLFRIDVSKKRLSDPLATEVSDYYSFMGDNIIAFVSNNVLWALKGTEKEKVVMFEQPVRIAATNFYDSKYLVVYDGSSLAVYEGEGLKEVLKGEANINLDNLKIMTGVGYVVARDDSMIYALDMEDMKLNSWRAEADSLGWLDKYLIYTISNGVLTAYDFDGQNERTLSENVTANYPATITNNRWMYYFSNGALMREWLVKK